MDKIFRPKLFYDMKDYSKKQFINDVVAGIIVAIIALPLSIALAIASGVSPEKGLYTAIVAGLLISVFGGSRVNISGPTAAFATIVAGIVAQFGINGLIVATIMAGIFLIIMGLLRFGSLIKYIPYTITTGFTSGIAVTIIIGQIKDFLGISFPDGVSPVETTHKLSAVIENFSTVNLWAMGLGIICLAILAVWPKISKKIPGSLVVVILGVLSVKMFDLEVNTIGDLFTISRDLPKFALPDITFDAVKELIPSAFTIAILAGIESLLSCVVSDNMIDDKHNSNTELIAQGIGNIFSGIFGGIPATGAIARTAANVKNGGKTPVSGIVHALTLLLILVILMPYAAWIPMPVIAAILFMVAYNMCEWRRFVKICKTAPKSDIIVLLVTFVLTVIFDLVVAIEIGMLFAVVLFMKRMAEVTQIRTWTEHGDSSGGDSERLKAIPHGTKVFEVDGPMFFATADKLEMLPISENIDILIMRMRNIPSLDASAMQAMNSVYMICKKNNIKLLFSHANEQPLSVMKKSGFYDKVGADCFLQNIDEALSYAQTLSDVKRGLMYEEIKS